MVEMASRLKSDAATTTPVTGSHQPRRRQTPRLYLMKRSLEVLRKFHWMILEGRFNKLSHVSSPLLSKPGEIYLPPKTNLSYSGLDEFQQPEFESYGPKSCKIESKNASENISNELKESTKVKESSDVPLVKKLMSDDKLDKKIVVPSDAKIEFFKAKQQEKPVRKPVKYAEMYRLQGPRGNQRNWNNLKFQQLGTNFVTYNKACYVCGSFEHLQYDYDYHQTQFNNQRMEKPVWNNARGHLIKDYDFHDKKMVLKPTLQTMEKETYQKEVRPVCNNGMRINHQNFSNYRRKFAPTIVLTKSEIVPISTARQSSSRAAALVSTARPINTAAPKPLVNVAKTRQNAFQKRHSLSRRPFYQQTTLKNIYLVNSAKVKFVNIVNTAKGKSVTSAFGKQRTNAVKSLAYWVWRPKIKEISPFSQTIKNMIEDLLLLQSVLKEILHMDIFGPTFIKSIMGKMYYLVVTDDYSRFSWVFFFAKKDETSEILKDFRTGIENQLNHKVKIIRCDNESEFKNYEMNQFCRIKGIMSEFMLNTSLDVASSNEEVVSSPKDNVGKKSTVELTYVEGVKIDDLVCLDQQMKSTDDSENTNSTNSFNTASPTINTASDKDGTFQRTYGEWNLSTPITVNAVGSSFSHLAALDDFSKMPNLEDTRVFDDAYDDRDEDAEADYNNLETVIPVTPIPSIIIHKDHPKEQIIGEVNSVIQTKKMAKQEEAGLITFINKQRRINQKDFQNCLFACFLSQIEPNKVTQALDDESWVEAIQEELLQFKLLNVWTLVDLPHGKRAIRIKWVYKNKRDQREIFVRNKVRLVAQGYRQEKGIDYDEDFAPIARIEAIMLFLAYASFMDFTVYQMDVKSAFLYDTVEEEVYVSQPLDFVDPAFPDKVYKLKKALYGLHQDLRAWSLSTEFEQLMHNGFQMSSMGELTFFLGLQVKQRKEGIFLSQEKYVCDILKKFGFSSVKSAVKRIFRYLKGHPTLGIWYPKDSPLELIAYLDSDYAGASLDIKSITGEYIAASSCCGQVLWLQNQLLDYGYNFIQTKIHVDNESAICVVKNPVYYSKTKHIKIGHHFIRDSYEKRLIEMVKIHNDSNVADLLTKAFDVRIELKGYFLNDDYVDLVQHAGDIVNTAGQTATGKEFLNSLMAGSLPKTISLKSVQSYSKDLFLISQLLLSNPHNFILDLNPGSFSSLNNSMANLKFVDQHNMVAYLEKSGDNTEFHQIVDFLSSCFITYALTVSPTIYASYIQQFWNTASSKIVNSIKQIHVIVDGKAVVISESLVRSDLLFADEDEGHTSKSRKDRLEENIKLTDIIPTPQDSPLIRGYTPRSDEGRITLVELIEICATLSKRVTQLENELSTTKAIYNKAFITLTNKVKKLESQLKQKKSSAVIHSLNEEGQSVHIKDSPKQRRIIEEIDKDENINLRSLAKDKGKGIMQETKLPKKLKKKEKIQLSLDKELAQKLYAEELAKEGARQEQEGYNLEKDLEL
uniref:Integrase catalytic domain-containing protein n=1 Tax=Tanacetum cinerariifolium TaxID=118510 RepID=A0A6L2JQU2_TANCI|nr:hypothetical protein [Tanacetum cinerariifolium]